MLNFSNFILPLFIVPENTKIVIDICHAYDMAIYMTLFSTICIFFENSYINLNLILFLFCIILVGSFKNILEFFKLFKFFFILKNFFLITHL